MKLEGTRGNAYSAVDLPEFGTSVSWAMCCNTMCPSFGIPFSGPAPRGERTIRDDRYEIDTVNASLRCLDCNGSSTLHSNRAIRRLARHYLSLSLPFATCPNPDCENHGVNVFESQGAPRPKDRPYRVKDRAKHRVACRKCRTEDGRERVVTLGRALGMKGTSGSAKNLSDFLFWSLNARAISPVLKFFDISAKTYFERMNAASERLRHYTAYRNAALLKPESAERAEPLVLQTDALHVSLRPGAKYQGKRRRVGLQVMFSVVELPEDRTRYLLAAHPWFLPDALCEKDLLRLAEDAWLPAHLSEWEFADHPMRGDRNAPVDSQMRNLPVVGRGGWFTRSPYTELAHFLTVRKMLERFPKVHHHMDGQPAQARAALVALANDVRAGRWEVCLVKANEDEGDKRGKKGKNGNSKAKRAARKSSKPAWPKDPGKRREWLEENLDRQWRSRVERERAAVENAEGRKGKVPRAGWPAALFAKARQGPKKGGRWAWIEHPPPGKSHEGAKSLWLTQRPGADFETFGRDLLRSPGLLAVDGAHDQTRNRSRGAGRPVWSARSTLTYDGSEANPSSFMSELSLVILNVNFGDRGPPRRRDSKLVELDRQRGKRKGKSKPRPPRAWSMGLMAEGEAPESDLHLGIRAMGFRLGVDEAEEISRWLRGG